MKINIKLKRIILLYLGIIVFLFIFFPRLVLAREQYRQSPAIIHISSGISDGRYSPLEITEIARQSKFEIVVFNEREIMRWEYGIWPLRNIVKKVVENNSIAIFGIKKYFKLIDELNRKTKDVIVVGAVESTPFYFWSGSVFDKNFALNNAHKHLLVMGLSPSALVNLPIVGNRFSLYGKYQFRDIMNFWPLVVLLLGIFLFFSLKQRTFRNTLEREDYRNKKILFGGLMILGFIMGLNNYPFKTQLFDQYHGDRGVMPYQRFIDYVNENNGLVFWAHPEAENYSKTKQVEIITKKHVQDFYDTRNFTGFSIFYEGYETIGKPGGIWDKVLNEYSQGKRSMPVWAIAGLAFDFSGNLKDALKDLRNMVLLDDFSSKGVLEALKKGRVYVIRGAKSSQFILEEFLIEDLNNQQTKGMGETFAANNSQFKIKIMGYFLEENETDQADIQVSLIKNGEIIKLFLEKNSFNIEFIDYKINQSKDFYRIELKSKDLHLITNPIFVE